MQPVLIPTTSSQRVPAYCETCPLEEIVFESGLLEQ